MRACWIAVLIAVSVCLALVCAQTSVSALSVRPYYVTNAAAFPALPLPAHALIFRNGIYQTPGIDYAVLGGSAFRMRSVENGDIVSVVTLP